MKGLEQTLFTFQWRIKITKKTHNIIEALLHNQLKWTCTTTKGWIKMSKNPQKNYNANLNAHEKTIVINKTQQNWNAHCELYANSQKDERPKMYATN
jgi:hypothetical protein